MQLTKRQKELLKHIIDEYIESAQPVGSKIIIEKYMNNISGATIRNEMALLEQKGYLEKNHISSGRVPSNLAYKLYDKEFTISKLDENIKLKLRSIFENRKQSIDLIIDESAKVISEIMKLPLVTIEKNDDIKLKRVDLVEINDKSALMIIILSNGDLSKNVIEIENIKLLKDLSICIRIFNDRLVDCSLNNLNERLDIVKKLIREKVQSYEFIMQEVVERIFNIKTKISTNIIGSSSLINFPEFSDHQKLKEVLKMLENTSVWEQLALRQETNNVGTTSITFGDELGHDNVLFASTDIGIENNKTQLVMVSPTRVDYSKIKGLLDFVREEFKKMWNKN